MSASATITATMREATLAHYDALKEAVASVSKAVIALRKAEDILDVIAAVDAYSLACEALAIEAAHTHDKADDALLAALQEAGAPSLVCNGHTLSTRRNAPTVDIFGPVPDAYLAEPKPPAPDRIKIRKALQNGHPLNWAALRDSSLSLVRKPTTP